MRILSINNSNQISSKAVNQKYYKWAQKEVKETCGLSEILFRIEAEVCWKDMLPVDAIDTINAIKELAPHYKGFESTLDYVKKFLPSQK